MASATGSGLVEFFRIGPDEQGVYGLMTANSNRGRTNWTFRPLKSIDPGKIVFTDAGGSFSIEATPDGGIHYIAMRVVDGKETNLANGSGFRFQRNSDRWLAERLPFRIPDGTATPARTGDL